MTRKRIQEKTLLKVFIGCRKFTLGDNTKLNTLTSVGLCRARRVHCVYRNAYNGVMYNKCMKEIVVLGANGRSGRECVRALLAAGFHVRAGVHSGRLPDHPRLTQYAIDATRGSDIARLIGGINIVVSLLGHVWGGSRDLQLVAMRHVIAALKNTPSSRIITLTGTGVRMPGDTPSLLDYLLNATIRLIDPQRIKDGIKHVRFLQASSVDWTVIRVLKLTNRKNQGTPLLSEGGPAELFTPRARVAAAIVNIVTSDTYHQKAPVISGFKK